MNEYNATYAVYKEDKDSFSGFLFKIFFFKGTREEHSQFCKKIKEHGWKPVGSHCSFLGNF